MKRNSMIILCAAGLMLHAPASTPKRRVTGPKPVVRTTVAQTKIQVALLLDTSGSMDGLIEQAKSQLWQIVNELATARYSGVQPSLEIALYDYGNDGYSPKNGYVRQVLPFTGDLDKVSEELFKLRTNGGEEYCGEVIRQAVDDLEWSSSNEDLKLIYIAGNEPFNQGNTNYKTSCKSSISKGIVVNTIFCGGNQEGISSSWKDGADLADGSYISIDHNQQVAFVETPFDDELLQLNAKLNETYIAYGESGSRMKSNQLEQDENASQYGKGNAVIRTTSKSSGMYKNSTWDLVDAKEDKSVNIETLKEEELPKEMQKMTKEERVAYVDTKAKERESLNGMIIEVNKKRTAFITEKQKEAGNENSLDKAVIRSVRQLAAKKNYTFEQ